ncbi:MAG: EamA family transporter RarD [Anaerolineales bacterium]|nr:EamA family transporter RarD [Anaerolineales bacterium]
MNKGIWYALGAYLLWGLFPIYWKWLHDVPALQLIGHRIGWSFILLMIVIVATKQWTQLRSTLTWRVLGIYLSAGLLLSVNWLIYVWGVNSGHIVETSLGYFINPLLSVLLGVIFLGERLRPAQWLPVGLAALGVIYLTWTYGSLPWIALSLAFSFGFYGLVKKTSPLGSLYGLTLETGLVFLPAVGYLIFTEATGQGAFSHTGLIPDLLMIGGGVVTTVPLLMFASAARRIPLTMVGIMQYIAPTLQFLLGVLLYKEPFTSTRLVGFSLVWVALVIFWVEGALAHRAQRGMVEAV